MIIYPEVTMIITNHFTISDVQTRVHTDLACIEIIVKNPGIGKDDPFIVQQEVSRR